MCSQLPCPESSSEPIGDSEANAKCEGSNLGAPLEEPAAPHAESTYEVGRGKPPKHTQFRKGQSGNPWGRPPRKKKDLPTCIEEALAEKYPLTSTGRAAKVTAAEVIAHQLKQKVEDGNSRALRLLQRVFSTRTFGKSQSPAKVRETPKNSAAGAGIG